MQEHKLEAVLENGVPVVKITCGQCGQEREKAPVITMQTECEPSFGVETPPPGGTGGGLTPAP